MYNINNLFLEIQEKKNDSVLQVLDELGINAVDNFGRTAVMNAAFYNNTELLGMLIEKKADLDLKDKNGYTALHFSAQEAHTGVTDMLLQHGANPDITDKHGNTPAWVAIANWKAGKNLETLKSLVKHKADLTIKNDAGRAAFDLIPPAIKTQLGIE